MIVQNFSFESEIEKIEILLSQLNNNKELNINKIKKLNKEKEELYKRIYSNLDPWQKVQVSRHGDRPHTVDYIRYIFDLGNILFKIIIIFFETAPPDVQIYFILLFKNFLLTL